MVMHMKLFKRITLTVVTVVFAAAFLSGCGENEAGMVNMIYDSYNLEQYVSRGTAVSNYSSMDADGNFVPVKNIFYTDISFENYINNSDESNPYSHTIVYGAEFGDKLRAPMEMYQYNSKKYLSLDVMGYINDMSFTSEYEPGDSFVPVYDAVKAEFGSDCFVEFDESFWEGDFIFRDTKMIRNIALSYPQVGINANNGIKPFANSMMRDYLFDSLSGFDSEAVEKTENGYSFVTNNIITRSIADRLDKYMIDNEEHTYSAYLKYAETLGLDINSSSEFDFFNHDMRKLSYEEFCAGIENSYNIDKIEPREDAGFTKLTTEYSDGVYRNTYSELTDFSKIQSSGLPKEAYEGSILEYFYDAPYDRKMFDENITAQTVEPVLPSNIVTYEEYNAVFNAANNRLNPVIGIEFEKSGYAPGGENIDAEIPDRSFTTSKFTDVFVHGMRQNGLPDEITYKDFGLASGPGIRLIKDEKGSIYVPLRTTAEYLGEVVGWDDTVQSAYILRNGEVIPTEGVLVKGNAFLEELWYAKARDFEKLGYTVDYSETVYEDNSERKEYKVTIRK